jgi:rhodanese-related sulfurtransferase
VKFLLDNLYLIAIALVSGGMLLWPLIKRGSGSASVSPLQATQLINHRNAIVVDVRDEQAFATGSVTGARNLPFAKLDERAAELARFKARPVIVVCESGQQSARALAAFKAQGFEEAHSLAGGITAWKQAGLPLVQANRDTGRPAQKEGARNRGKNEIRTGDKSKTSKSGARVPPAGPASLNGSAVIDDVNAKGPAATPDPANDTTKPDRVKELS